MNVSPVTTAPNQFHHFFAPFLTIVKDESNKMNDRRNPKKKFSTKVREEKVKLATT